MVSTSDRPSSKYHILTEINEVTEERYAMSGQMCNVHPIFQHICIPDELGALKMKPQSVHVNACATEVLEINCAPLPLMPLNSLSDLPQYNEKYQQKFSLL